MEKGRIRHMFPGGNTSEGFYSYYDYVLPQERAERIFILKGGPGVGKSTFMKKIAEEMLNRGYDVEYMHCSSDPSSLDGIVIPAKNVAVIDGTAPHVIDPKNPGAVDEIINLGRFWNNDGIVKNRDMILKTNMEISSLFQRAYRYIKAGYSLYRDNEAIYGMAMDHGKANVIISETVDRIFSGIGISEVVGKQRRLFASAITPEGLVNHLSSLVKTEEVIVIEGNPGTGTERLLERVREAAVERGIYTESYYCALNPHKLEHLIIPELDVSLTTSNKIHHIDRNPTQKIDLNEFLDGAVIQKYGEVLDFNRENFEMLLNRAIATIKQAKEKHDELESFYVPNMNFDEIQKYRDELLKSLV
ncbi:MAG: ATPase [Clostridiaceae bacterium]|nr:ATPase [Clostridiaceae bacterium]